VVLADGFLERVRRISLLLKQKLAEIKDRYPTVIAELRGEGLLVGLRAVVPSADLVDELRAEKMITVAAGDNVVRLLPPLIVSEEEVAEAVRRIDVLFANAGFLALAPLGSITEDHFDNLFDVNVKGVLFTVQKALPLFTNGGSIILTSSFASSEGPVFASVYSASKAAVRSFARCWTMDLRHHKIRVNAVCPGPIDTPMLRVFVARPDQRFSQPLLLSGSWTTRDYRIRRSGTQSYPHHHARPAKRLRNGLARPAL
jgi:NAD(P)-dependent dehydrogenase (short-subunit alcohol dehydrogenase family)